jgi:uncharacterized protein YjiK
MNTTENSKSYFIKLFLMLFYCLLICSCRESIPLTNQLKDDEVDTLKQNNLDSNKINNDLMINELPYRLDEPDAVFGLSYRLEEISGLSISPDGESLIAINDELGVIFFLSKNSGKILRTINFGKSGDFEGIEAVGDTIYTVKSNGNIYKIANTANAKTEAIHFKTKLSAKNNVEGLGYDSVHHYLLLACKGTSEEGASKDKRAIYAFDLAKNELLKSPILLIDRKVILKEYQKKREYNKLEKFLGMDKLAKTFSPSGISIHPITKDYYLLSSIGKLLLVLNQQGELKYIEKLNSSIFNQPEGICFDSSGVMFISSEGKGGNGRLFRLDPK